MSKTMKRVSALLLAILMIVTYMPMMQETAYAAKKAKKPAKVKGLKATVKKNTKKIALSWKKAKNAKKYLVTIKDNSTKLSATKTSKKTKLTITGQWNTKYTIKVQGVNGKKKGSAAKKTVKIGADPSKVSKSKYDADMKKAAEENKAAVDSLTQELASAVKALETAKANSATQAEAVEKAKAIIEAYDKAVEDGLTVPEDLAAAIEDARQAVKDAEIAAATELTHPDWDPFVRDSLNAMIKANANSGKYVVFDFDNTCSIFDVEEQLALHQLRTMSFVIKPEDMPEVLATELDKQYFYEKDAEGKPIAGTGKPVKANADYCENKDARYDDWIDDISAAYGKLWTKYGPFTADGVNEATQATLLTDDDWKEFATKIRTMYDLVYDTESAAVAYPWVLYWFTGMTEAQVYKLAKDSHTKYNAVETERVKFETPESSKDDSKIGRIGSYDKNDVFSTGQKFFNGTTVSDNIRELMAALDNNGIDVWVCSASATDPIRAAIDTWGLHDHVTGMMAMTNKLDADGKYINAYDWDGGYAWKPIKGDVSEAGWKKDDAKQKTQTQGKGKVIAIQNVVYPKYNNHGPIAGFMDSTGDFNFCTEFKTLQVVCCFNRADRKETDGGGVIAEVATYEKDTLGYNYDKARANDDTLYVLQGRDERELRKLNPDRATYVFKQLSDEKGGLHVFGSEYGRGNNETQLQYMIDNNMTVKDAINQFAIKQDAGPSEKNPFNFKIGFVYGQPGEGLGPKFQDDTYNPDALDFSGYHSQN